MKSFASTDTDVTLLKSSRVLITGASGFIGSNLFYKLQQTGVSVVAAARNVPAMHPLAKHFITADITTYSFWTDILPKVDTVLHLAAQTSASFAEKNIEKDYLINVTPAEHLVAAAKQLHLCPNVIFAGTSTQFGIPSQLPVTEQNPDAALTVYDNHKQAAENLLLTASRSGDIKACSLRLTNVYGPGVRESASDRGVLNQMLRQAWRGETLQLFENADCLRDFLFIEDCTAAFLKAAASINACKDRVFLIGSGEGYSFADAAGKILDAVRKQRRNFRLSIEQSNSPRNLQEIEFRNFIANPAAFSQTTGWKPAYSLDRGIMFMLESLKCES